MTLVPVDSEFNNCTFSFSHNKIYVFFAVPFFSSVLGHYFSILFSLGLLVSIVVALFLGVLSFSALVYRVFPWLRMMFPLFMDYLDSLPF